jgi:SAM-dependent methyltransferase
MTDSEEALSIFFNFVFTREKPSFRTDPNALLVETVKDIKPGRALDVAMGQGRNAIWLAEQGWDVTGFDISTEGIAAARSAAERKGVKIATVQSSWQKFDFGQAQWDLIVFSYAFVPMWDSEFFARVRASTRRQGLIVFEHYLHDGSEPLARFAGTPEPNELLHVFTPDFRVLRYEEPIAETEWFSRKSPLVRMVARRL